MSSYTYDNGVYMVTTPIYYGFNRFHNCNAQHRHLRIMNLDRTVTHEVWQFISYDTKICQIEYDHKYDTWHVFLNANVYNYSRTTSKQFNRWIRENNLFVTVPDIQNALDKCFSVTPDVSVYYTDSIITVSVYDNYRAFQRVWRN